MSAKGQPGRAGQGTTLADVVYNKLYNLIADGSFAERGRLPPEHALADRFGASRPTVREALARLRDEGLIVSRRGAGNFVRHRPDDRQQVFAPLSSILEIDHCFDFRITLEGDAAAFAAERATPQTLAGVAERVSDLSQALGAGRIGTVEPDFQFHLAVAEASGNRFFIDGLRMLRGSIVLAMNLAGSLARDDRRTRMSLIADEHRAIYQAIASRDAEAARDLMRRHLRQARTRMFKGRAATTR